MAKNKVVAGYYTSWSRLEGFSPDKIKVGLLTHIHYAFAAISPGLTAFLPTPGTDVMNLMALRRLKADNPGISVLLSVGGWDYSGLFSDVALSQASRQKFAASCMNIIMAYGLDGVDIDWEYPVKGGKPGNLSRPQDKGNFTLLLEELRRGLDNLRQTNGKKYYLSFAAGGFSDYLNWIEPEKAAAIADYVFVMAYDLNIGPDLTGFNAPLNQPENKPPEPEETVSQVIEMYLAAKVPADKLVLGTPFYGYVFDITKTDNNGLYMPYDDDETMGYDGIVSGYVSKPGFKRIWDNGAKVPYLFGNHSFITYDDVNSISEKSKYAASKNLLGVGAWELSYDKRGLLLNALVSRP